MKLLKDDIQIEIFDLLWDMTFEQINSNIWNGCKDMVWDEVSTRVARLVWEQTIWEIYESS